MPSHATIKRYIARTKSKLRRQREKLHHSQETSDKIAAKEEIRRLVKMLSWLQGQSNLVEDK